MDLLIRAAEISSAVEQSRKSSSSFSRTEPSPTPSLASDMSTSSSSSSVADSTKSSKMDDTASVTSSSSTSSHTCSPSSSGTRKRRNRRRVKISELKPDMVAKVREANRIAARRHRHATKKRMEELMTNGQKLQDKIHTLRRHSEKLAKEIALKRALVVQLYTSGHVQAPPQTLMQAAA